MLALLSGQRIIDHAHHRSRPGIQIDPIGILPRWLYKGLDLIRPCLPLGRGERSESLPLLPFGSRRQSWLFCSSCFYPTSRITFLRRSPSYILHSRQNRRYYGRACGPGRTEAPQTAARPVPGQMSRFPCHSHPGSSIPSRLPNACRPETWNNHKRRPCGVRRPTSGEGAR